MVRFCWFFLKAPKYTKYSPYQKKTGQLHGLRVSDDRKHHSMTKTGRKCRGRICTLATKLKKAYKVISFVHFTKWIGITIPQGRFMKKISMKFALLMKLWWFLKSKKKDGRKRPVGTDRGPGHKLSCLCEFFNHFLTQSAD